MYSKEFPDITFQPTECDEFNRGKINQTCRDVRRGKAEGGVREALELNVMEEDSWRKLRESQDGSQQGRRKYDLVIGHNFIHMLPLYVELSLHSSSDVVVDD